MADYLGLGMPVDGRSMNPGQSLFNPQTPFGGDQIASPYSTEYVGTSEDAPAIEAFMLANGITDISQGRKAYYSQQQQPSPYGKMSPGDALGGAFTMQPPTPVQQLSSPTLTDLAQTQPFTAPVSQPVPMATQPPETQQLVQQIQAPTSNMPTPSIPMAQPSPATQQLISQIQAPTAPRRNPFARPTPQAVSRPQPRPAPMAPPRPVAQPVRQNLQVFPSRASPQPMAKPQPMARSVSRVNPPLLPSRPTGRR